MSQIPDRRLIALRGQDVLTFLQGLVSNDVLPLADEAGLVWTALLSPQGKYLAEFFVVNTGGSLLLDLPETAADDVLKRLTLYRLRADVQMTPSSLIVSRGLGVAPAGALSDPRHPALGWRFYGAEALNAPQPDWDVLRIEHLVPEHGRELLPNDSYILEFGFERLHGVNFKKGCYVGQEVTARMKHKTELRKGLARITLEGEATEGAPILNGSREIGRLGTISGAQGMAWLRFDQAEGELTSGQAKITQV